MRDEIDPAGASEGFSRRRLLGGAGVAAVTAVTGGGAGVGTAEAAPGGATERGEGNAMTGQDGTPAATTGAGAADPQGRFAVVAKFYELYDAKAADRLGEVVAEDVVDRNAVPGLPPGLAGEQALLQSATAPFSNVRHEWLVAEPVGEDQVLVVWRFTGRHTGELVGVPATGRTVEFQGMDLLTVREGKIVEHRHVEEVFQLLRQVQPAS